VNLPWLDAATIESTLSFAEAVDALEHALRSGLDPTADFDRAVVEVAHGQLLLMPSQAASGVGVKVATVSTANPARGLPRIQGVYLLCDAETLTPMALLDGSALTLRRTPAVSALAVRYLAGAVTGRLVVLGTGPQAWGHVEAVRAVRDVAEVVVVGRDAARAAGFAARLADTGVPAVAGPTEAVADAVAGADLVLCATSAAAPLFPGEVVPDHTCVVAVGSHEPGVRELDAQLMRRSAVVVEDRDTALREAGDVILAGLDRDALVDLADVVRGTVAVSHDRPRVFKSVGMGWEDLVVAAETVRRL
jgi:ornithine cyclodeaminase/alanine dehydrogenase-like protein (mu-crystallin family)